MSNYTTRPTAVVLIDSPVSSGSSIEGTDQNLSSWAYFKHEAAKVMESFPSQPFAYNVATTGLTPYDWNDMFEVWSIYPARIDPTERAQFRIKRFPDKTMAAKADDVLKQLRAAWHNADLAVIPSLHVSTPEDGSLLIEWASSHWRIGFSIEQEDSESGWYLVSDKAQGNIRAYGDLHNFDAQWLVAWALTHMN